MAAYIGRAVGLANRKGEDKSSGTIKFWGKTAFQEGDWVGVELDRPNGKNDGSVNGVSYFQCKPGFGLFVRPDALDELCLEDPMGSLTVNENKESDFLDFWFETAVKCFSFCKPTQEWNEMEAGVAVFQWNSQLKKIAVSLGSSIDHVFCPSTKIAPTVITQQSWVFRAYRNDENENKEVLCFQFPSSTSTRDFVSQLDHYRAPYKSPGKTKKSSKKGETRVMRRRLTVSGSNPNLDGYQEGARLETDTPGPASPKKIKRGDDELWESKPVIPSNISVAAYSGISRKGFAPYNPDKQNQDSMIMVQLPFSNNCKGELLLCVFDGHGEHGHHVSRHFRNRLPELLKDHEQFSNNGETERVLRESLQIVEEEVIANTTINSALSGTTAVVTVIRDDLYFVANVGDSRVVKATTTVDKNNKETMMAVDLSIDHKPDSELEQQRIESIGGRVFAIKYDDGIDGPARVWLADADTPGLAMSRSMCDTVGKRAGVISEAETFVHRLISKKDTFLIIATDGLWEFMTSQEVCDIVSKHVDSRDCRSALTELVAESSRRWQEEEPVIDDTTIIIAFLE